MASNDFEVEVTAWVRTAKARAAQVFNLLPLYVVDRIKQLTPVVTGNLRASWIVQLDGQVVTGNGAGAPLGRMLVISTNVVYARRVEYGFVGEDSLGRHYDQKGRGMVQQTIAELPQIVKQVIRDVRAAGGSPNVRSL